MQTRSEDKHFLIDSVSPNEAELVLRTLDWGAVVTTENLRELLGARWGHQAQRNFTNTTRRLLDVGALTKKKTATGKPGHAITELGDRLGKLSTYDHALYDDAMHYLHYSGCSVGGTGRKLFWSYYQCCRITWQGRQVLADEALAGQIQQLIEQQFPYLLHGRTGGRFNDRGVSAGWRPWIMRLKPCPLDMTDRKVTPRREGRYELVLLALDRVYRQRGYRFGDPVLLDDALLDEVASVFFLDSDCCRQLVELAARLTRTVRLSETFAGTAITLLEPYTVDRI